MTTINVPNSWEETGRKQTNRNKHWKEREIIQRQECKEHKWQPTGRKESKGAIILVYMFLFHKNLINLSVLFKFSSYIIEQNMYSWHHSPLNKITTIINVCIKILEIRYFYENINMSIVENNILFQKCNRIVFATWPEVLICIVDTRQ